MADGRHLKKSKRPYLRNALTDLHKIWHDDALWPLEGHGQLKFPNLWKSKISDGRHLEKIKNGHISATVRPSCTKFGIGIHRQRVR